MSEEAVVTTETQEVPLEESTMQEYKAARKEGKEVATRDAVAEDKPAEEKPRGVKGGFQARIDRLIKQTAALEEAKNASDKKAADLEAKLNGKGEAAPAGEGEPKRDDFTNDADYNRALMRWEVRQEFKAEREAEAKAAVEATANEARGRYNQKMIALQAEDDEIKELFKQDLKIPSSILEPITLEMENGAEVSVFLAQNPELCSELLEMSPSRAIAEVWKISEKLEAAGDEKVDEEVEEKPVEKPAPRKVPAPLRTVSGGNSRSTVPLGQADYQAYKKLRAQGRVQ